jgi:magnesium transporter
MGTRPWSSTASHTGQKTADISVEAISDYVVRPECFVWVALFEPSDEELGQMALEFGLHELAVEDARKGHQRPKIEEYGSSMFTVLQTVDIDPASPDGDLLVGDVAIFVGRNYVLSVRRKSPHGFQSVRARAEAEPENLARGSGFVLYAIMDTVVDRYFPVLARLEADLERLETEIFLALIASNLEAFYDLSTG